MLSDIHEDPYTAQSAVDSYEAAPDFLCTVNAVCYDDQRNPAGEHTYVIER
ncbi:MAG: hypothetical protein IJK98_08815 [Clostridia bacterium]|nr:hypothetical protein [Clostridia bacterium]